MSTPAPCLLEGSRLVATWVVSLEYQKRNHFIQGRRWVVSIVKPSVQLSVGDLKHVTLSLRVALRLTAKSAVVQGVGLHEHGQGLTTLELQINKYYLH